MGLIIIVAYYNCLPAPLFQDPTSTILYSEDSTLLGASIADDGQWRFPENKNLPIKFKTCITHFEDEYFRYHPGVNPISICKAAWYNLNNSGTRGGSTITMQTIRIARKGKSRTLKEKLIEAVMATRLELRYSKDEILRKYASYAPFGGNVVGIEAASWRYYKRKPSQLSWGESATLAVLPNAPSLIHPGKNRDLLIAKRNRLLKKLWKNEVIDSTTYILAALEQIPDKPSPLPQLAPHLLTRVIKEGKKGQSIYTTINTSVQKSASRILKDHHKHLSANQVHNGAILILDVNTGNTVAYVGNTLPDKGASNHGNSVDIITSNRSTGSILKPFLYAAMLDDGEILPETLVKDVPTYISGYTPKNYSLKYNGAVPARMALARSLNIPSVHLLRSYGIPKFIALLKKLGLSTVNKNADHYGLTLILGGAEANLWELCGTYASMARTLKNYSPSNISTEFRSPTYEIDQDSTLNTSKASPITAASIWETYISMLYVNRPESEIGWENFSSSHRVAYKTGTSFGNRDAWAIAMSPNYVVGVWIGNADGEGRPNITGIGAAAPVLFDLLKMLPKSNEPVNKFDPPYDQMREIEICAESGHRPSKHCENKVKKWIPLTGLNSAPCPYHKMYHFDQSLQYQVHASCEDLDNIQHRNWFVLPPVQEWYYKIKNPSYTPLPPFRPDCIEESGSAMQFIYPKNGMSIYLPKDYDGTINPVIMEIAHPQAEQVLYWHLDNNYLGTTRQFHTLECKPESGPHTIVVMDGNGNKCSVRFEVVER